MEIANELTAHQELYQDLLNIVEREGRQLREPGDTNPLNTARARDGLIPRLNESLDKLKRCRIRWVEAIPAERARHPEIAALLRQSQDLIMRIIVQDRENEQALLRRGMIPPRHLPPVNRQRPHFVADVYRRQGAPA